MEPKTIKVARVGEPVQEICVESETSVKTALEAAGYNTDGQTIYAQRDDGTKTVVQPSDVINGYAKIFLTMNIKGGN